MLFGTAGLHCPEVAKGKASRICCQKEICWNPIAAASLPYDMEQTIYYPRAGVSVAEDGAGNYLPESYEGSVRSQG